MVCGVNNKSKTFADTVYKLDGPKFNCEKYICMPKELYFCKTAVVNSNLFVLGGFSKGLKFNKSIIKFCNKTKTWSSKAQLSLNDNYFCVCSFKNNLNLINKTGHGFVYNLKADKSFQLADTKEERYFAACTVFEGKIVVTGGYSKSVEAYDYYENKWNNLPDMIEKRCDHATVSMGNKMFVIGGYHTKSCEVLDSLFRKFICIKSGLQVIDINSYYNAFSVGNCIVVFHNFMTFTDTTIYKYDVCENKWSTINCDLLENLFDSSFVKYYTQ